MKRSSEKLHDAVHFRIFILISLLFVLSCNKKDEQPQENQGSTFTLTSSAIGADSLLPAEYTCDGLSSTLPLEWSGSPAGTQWFALIMDHLTPDNEYKWYWIIYDIPAGVIALPKNVTGIGSLGTNSVNGRNEYAPPCSQGPGRKNYILTLYALSEKVAIDVPAGQVNREYMLNAIKDITIESVSMTVWYSRDVK